MRRLPRDMTDIELSQYQFQLSARLTVLKQQRTDAKRYAKKGHPRARRDLVQIEYELERLKEEKDDVKKRLKSRKYRQ